MLLAYGQTGSGKTFTLLGSEAQDTDSADQGVLAQAIRLLLSNDKVSQCWLSAIEVYSVSHKLEMYDLFDAANMGSSAANLWYQKSGRFEVTEEGMIRKTIGKATDIDALILLAQSAAHYAPTGKNPHSSRGHTAFIVTVEMADSHRCNFL